MEHDTNLQESAQMLDDLLWLNSLRRTRDSSQPMLWEGAVDAMIADYTDDPDHYSDGSRVSAPEFYYYERRFIGEKALPPPHRPQGHYHILSVWQPGSPDQRAECSESKGDLSETRDYLGGQLLRDDYPECDAIWIIGCGPGHCRANEICDLPIEEWGEPYWTLADLATSYALKSNEGSLPSSCDGASEATNPRSESDDPLAERKYAADEPKPAAGSA